MAVYDMKITAGRIVKTLIFQGRGFQEIWQPDVAEDCCSSGQIMENQVKTAFPDLDADILDIVEELTCLDEDELADAMKELTYYEKYLSEQKAGASSQKAVKIRHRRDYESTDYGRYGSEKLDGSRNERAAAPDFRRTVFIWL